MKKLLLYVIIILLLVPAFAQGDIPSSWAKDAIDEIFDQKLLSKHIKGNYQREITRREFAYLGVVIYEKITGKTTIIGSASFPDTSDEYVLRAKNTGIIKGYEDGTYRPNRAISRQELAVLFVNALSSAEVNIKIEDHVAFKDDVKISSWAKDAVYIARSLRIVQGVGGNYYRPEGTATKEQAFIMFKRIIDKYARTSNEDSVKIPFDLGGLAPAFSGKTLDGKVISTGNLSRTPIVLNFFTSWCTPCLDEAKVLGDIHRDYTGKIQIIGINIFNEDKKESLKRAIKTYNISYPIILDEGIIKDKYKVISIPTTVIIDKNGKMVYYTIGKMSREALIRAIEKALD